MSKESQFIGYLGLLGLFFAAAVSAGADGKISMKPEVLKESGTVIVATDGECHPFNYLGDDNQLTGFEIEMIKEIAKRMGLDVEIKTLPWNGIFGQMDSQRIDPVMCCISPSAERLNKVRLFPRVYL